MTHYRLRWQWSLALIILFVLYFVAYSQGWFAKWEEYKRQPSKDEISLGTLAERNRVDISGCKFKPAEVAVRVGGTFEFYNSDQTRHTLSVNGKNYLVAGNSSTKVVFDFVDKPGSVKYRCDYYNIGTITILPKDI